MENTIGREAKHSKGVLCKPEAYGGIFNGGGGGKGEVMRWLLIAMNKDMRKH